jgi:hypothetical protein
MITIGGNVHTEDSVNYSDQTYFGLSTDSKPTERVGNGSIFVEIDTGKVFFFNQTGVTWVEQFSFQS